MPLAHEGFVDLPASVGSGGFDHAAVHAPTGRLYVAHTANDAIDVIDVAAQRYVTSIPGLLAVAGALTAEAPDLVFTSNRGENTVGIFSPGGKPTRSERIPVTEGRPGIPGTAPSAGGLGGPSRPPMFTVDRLEKIAVGVRPNGLAYDPGRGRLLVAHVGDPGVPGSHTVSVIDVRTRRRIADVPVAGRTRWTVFDPAIDAFHVNVMDPPQIAVVDAADPVAVRRVVPMEWPGPHGLDLDVARRRLYCACDAGVLAEGNADTGDVTAYDKIAGVPDVVFFNPALGRVYVAIGDPGVIEVFDTAPLRRRETVVTEPGAHTLAFDPAQNLVWAFLPGTHRAAVYRDGA